MYHESWCLYPWCMYSWCICLGFLILMHVCMMHVCMLHVSMILDPWPWCMYVWCIYRWSLTLMHVSTMRDFFRTNERTDGQGDSRSWIGINSFDKIRFDVSWITVKNILTSKHCYHEPPSTIKLRWSLNLFPGVFCAFFVSFKDFKVGCFAMQILKL